MILYKPEVGESCCPAYTIRLKVDCMEKSNEHVRVMRRMQRYLDGLYTSPSPKEREHELDTEGANYYTKPQCETSNMDVDSKCHNKLAKNKQNLSEKDFPADFLSSEIGLAINECILHRELPENLVVPKISVQIFQKAACRRGRMISSGEISYTCNVAFPCAAALLKQKSDCKIVNSAYSQCQGAEDKTIHRQVAAVLADTIASKLQAREKFTSFRVQACNGHLNFYLTGSSFLDKTKLSTMSGTVGGKDEKSTEVSGSQPSEMVLVKHKLEIRTRTSVFDPEEFSLYRKYQIAIHNEKPEDVSEDTFRRFLVDTPLTFVPPSAEEGDCFWGLGSFHQQYLIDGRLVAVGVIDILPSCLSSNYFFWDPDFAFLSLGRYSALKEIEWVQSAKKYCQSLEYYYLGHYIHSCPKMHYKVTFRPSELLCPIRVQWVPFELACPLLDKQTNTCLSDSLRAVQKGDEKCRVGDSTNLILNDTVKESSRENEAAGSSVGENTINSVLLKFEDHYLQFKQLREWLEAPEDGLDELISKLQNYTKIVGVSLAARMAYVLG